MNYVSTRGQAASADFSQALLSGLAPDGGLYLPETWPKLAVALPELSGGNYGVLTEALLAAFGAGVLGDDAVRAAADRTMAAFLDQGRTPLRQLDETLWLLELFHGPTLAFKDMAMQMMAPLLDAALSQRGEHLTLVTATSGDTGAAAVRAFAGSTRVRLSVFHPLGRVSPVQRLQMTTVEADNILNIGVEGDFDDCQRMVKTLLADPGLKARGPLSSVNSINWGRLLGQIPYYLAAQAASGIAAPDFVVPTGNFGDAFAGWAGRRIGGSVGGIHCAVNANDALNQAINHGHYVRRTATPCASVSMDVQAPSNFERLVFEASGRDAAQTRDVFVNFIKTGNVSLSPTLQAALKSEVSASTVSEAGTRAAIAEAHARFGVIICPHTAVGLSAALRRDPARPRIVLATAHPAKFPDVVTEALGFAPPVPEAIAALKGRSERLKAIGNADAEALSAVSGFISR